ncbi:MAG: DUF2125 domain-containing protein [Alphaproteobacteria bacterium]|nr:DUF2125 domain-containing protein [Alphaproteobacteria bacterium]
MRTKILSNLENLLEHIEAKHYKINYDNSLKITGYPFYFKINFVNPNIVFTDEINSWSFKSDRLTLQSYPWLPNSLMINEGTNYHMSFNSLWDLSGKKIEGDIELNSAYIIQNLRINLKNSSLKNDIFQQMQIGFFELSATRDDTPDQKKINWNLKIENFFVNNAFNNPLGQEIKTCIFNGELNGTPEKLSFEGIQKWSKEGGILNINYMFLDWSPLWLEGNGTFAFDPNMQPLLAMTANIKGYNETIEKLKEAKLLKPTDSAIGQFLLSGLSNKNTEGQPEVKLSITIQQGWFYLGPIKLFPIPQINWS